MHDTNSLIFYLIDMALRIIIFHFLKTTFTNWIMYFQTFSFENMQSIIQLQNLESKLEKTFSNTDD